MPYNVGSKGSNGCSGYPVVSDTGRVMGCHPTESNAQEQVAALYAAGAADKSDCCPDDLNKKSPCWEGYVQRGMKPGKNGKPVPNCVPVAKSENNSILPTPTYQHCECETCMEQNLQCSNCPDCQNGMDAQTEMDAYDASLGKTLFDFSNSVKLITKQTIRWDR